MCIVTVSTYVFIQRRVYVVGLYRFLKILQVIVLEPSASFRTFLPTVLNICLHHVCPVLTQVTQSL